ncbi:MAG: glycosyltransferase [Bacteroidales bacterium]|nr:glycosyltransferase [Bacteroidales bacterium]
MNDNVLVSVLIPVYGVEKYIEQCVRSLFSQTMKDGIEFIFTDDCTSDRSMEIIESVLNEFPERRNQVKVIKHRENQGLAIARLTGLHAARGKYVIHCDSDDWVEPDMYRLLYEEAVKSNADIVGCDYTQVFQDEEVVRKQDFSLNQDSMIPELIKGRKIQTYLWNRLIKRSFYIEGGYKAEKGTTLFEDTAVTVPMHINTVNVGYIPLPLYNYRCTDKTSMSATLTDRSIKSAIDVFYNLSLMPTREIWHKEISARLKAFLFCRALSKNYRDIKSWKNIELPILLARPVSLSLSEKLTVRLIKNKHFRSQYVVFRLRRIWKILMKPFKLFSRLRLRPL